MISRRQFLTAIAGSGVVIRSGVSALQGESIDREALVRRHNPVLRQLDPLSPLSLGNGEFAFTGDITGLQTFPQSYENAMPLCTMSQWGWHRMSPPADLDGKTLRLTQYDTYGRLVGYQTSSEGQADLYNWLRENPHRLHLGQIGLRLTNGENIRETELSNVHQELDLWIGRLTSTFKLNGKKVTVTSAVHPDRDLLAVRIDSILVAEGKLQVRLAFPLTRNPVWDRVINGLSVLPQRDGVYLAHENCPQTFTERNCDHPSMLGALGVLPGEGVDRETMRRTLFKVMNGDDGGALGRKDGGY